MPRRLPERAVIANRELSRRGGRGGCGCIASTRLRRGIRASRFLEDDERFRVSFWAAVGDSEGILDEFGAISFRFRKSLLQVS